MSELKSGITVEQERDWKIEVLKVGDAPRPWTHAWEVTYRSDGEALQKQEELRIRFEDNLFDAEMLKEFIDGHIDSKLVWVPGHWVNTDSGGYVSAPEVKMVGWISVETPEQRDEYEYYKADHAKRFPE